MPTAPTSVEPTTSTSNSKYTNTLKIIGRVNLPVNHLLEITGFVDTSKNFPTANAFVMFVPGKPDNTKLSGRTYVQDQRDTMKLQNRDVFAFAEALKMAATYGKCDFMVFTDSSKFAGNQGQGVTKKLSVSAAPSSKDPNKLSIFINYQGSTKVNIVIDRWAALGFANQILTLAQKTEEAKIDIERQMFEK